MPGRLNLRIVVVGAKTMAEARVKISRRLREMGSKKGRRCSDYDEDCSTMTNAEALNCYLGLRGSCPIADGYCPIIHGSN